MDKKAVLAISVIGIVAFVLGMAVAPKRSSAPVGLESKDKNSVQIVTVRDSSDPLYVVAIEYPQFDGASDAFNGEIAAWVNGTLDDFKKNARENWKARQDTTPPGQPKEDVPASPFTYAITWQPKQIGPTAISIIVRMDSYEGGASGRQELRTFNYDMVRGGNIELADLFPGDRAYLGKVSAYARERLTEDLVTGEDGREVLINMINDGAAPLKGNFENFVFNDDIVEFYFPKYQVAPGVYGEQHVRMPRKGL